MNILLCTCKRGKSITQNSVTISQSVFRDHIEIRDEVLHYYFDDEVDASALKHPLSKRFAGNQILRQYRIRKVNEETLLRTPGTDPNHALLFIT